MRFSKKMLMTLPLLLAILLPACSRSPVTAPATTKTSATQGQIVLKIGHGNNDKTPYHKALEKFVEVLEEKTSGAVTGQIYTSAILGNEREMAEGMALGTTDVSVASTAVLEAFSSKIKVLNAPFLIQSKEHAVNVLNSEVGEELARDLASIEWHHLGWMSSGFRNTFSTRPITKKEDYRGLKIRVMENNTYIRLFQILGALPVPMAASEQFTALQQGTIDANENGISNMLAESWYEVCKNATESEHIYGIIGVGISTGALKKIPEKYHADVFEAGKAMQEFQLQLIEEENSKAKEKLISLGVTFHAIDKAELKKTCEPLYAELNLPSGLVEKINALAMEVHYE
jgi:tripartite ATP-independent transporter DctP family solute receptor